VSAVFPDDTLIRLRALARHHRVRRLELLGKAPGGLDVATDFEFLVAFDGLPPSEHDRQYQELLRALETLLNASVDLIEELTFVHPDVLRLILPDRVTIYSG
jgi:uncharacterized protein